MPVASFRGTVKERPVLRSGGAVSHTYAAADPPHPNAQKVFANWWLSQRGQTVIQESANNLVPFSLRVDVTALTMVSLGDVRRPGVTYLTIGTDPDVLAREQEAYDFAKSVFGDVFFGTN